MLDNSLLTQSTHSSILVSLSSSDSKSLLILLVINHLLIRWIVSHQLVACPYRVNLLSIIHVFIHIWPTWLKVIVVVIVQCGLSPLLRRNSSLLFEKLLIGMVHLIPILVGRLENLYSLLKMPLLLDQLLDFNERVFTCILLKDSKSLPKILILLRKLKHLSVAVIQLL